MFNLIVNVLLLCISKWVEGVTQVIVCEGDSMILTCDPNQVISVQKANFGRMHPSVCSNNNTITNLCQSSNTLSKMQTQCDDRESCRVLATSENFGDECLGVSRYLTVYFECDQVTDTYDSPTVEAEFNTMFEHTDDIVTEPVPEDSSLQFDSTMVHTSSPTPSLKTTVPVTTKSSTTISTVVSKRCSCECSIHEIITDRNLIDKVQVDYITKSLAIDKKNLSSSKRKLTSVKDKRMSASVVGYVGVIILTCVFGIVIISDLLSHLSCTAKNMYQVSKKRKPRILKAN